MILTITKQVTAIAVKKQAVLRVRIAEFNIPAGILTSNFTQKGSLLVGTGPGGFTELPPGPDGAVLGFNSGSASGMSYVTLEAAFPPLFKQGLKLSNNVSDANNDIDIGTGACRDSADVFNFRLTTGITKRLDAAWAAGTNQGGLDAGSKAINTWYHVFIIRKDTDGSLDALFSTSATAPTMPSGYTYKRRVGAVRTSGNILPFYQHGSRFMWGTSLLDLNSGTQTSPTSFTISTPLGIKTKALGSVYAVSSSVVIFDADMSGSPASFVAHSNSGNMITTAEVYTNTSSQIKYYITGTSVSWYTNGWEELWES